MIRQKSYNDSPSLYLIPTPVGNMEDITLRAVNTLKMVDFILCEDTRITSELLSKLDIKKKLVHSDDHTEDGLKEMVLDKLKEGRSPRERGPLPPERRRRPQAPQYPGARD